MANKMERALPRRITGILKKAGILARRNGFGAFIVGGLVRDLMLGVKNLDLDIVIEGDAIKFAWILARELNGTLVAHRRFGTASVYLKDRLKIDLATARKEAYEAPAALPTVEFSSLKDDLARRDFTINAMAVSLNKENFGQLIDFFDGERDLPLSSSARVTASVDRSGPLLIDVERVLVLAAREMMFDRPEDRDGH